MVSPRYDGPALARQIYLFTREFWARPQVKIPTTSGFGSERAKKAGRWIMRIRWELAAWFPSSVRIVPEMAKHGVIAHLGMRHECRLRFFRGIYTTRWNLVEEYDTIADLKPDSIEKVKDMDSERIAGRRIGMLVERKFIPEEISILNCYADVTLHPRVIVDRDLVTGYSKHEVLPFIAAIRDQIIALSTG